MHTFISLRAERFIRELGILVVPFAFLGAISCDRLPTACHQGRAFLELLKRDVVVDEQDVGFNPACWKPRDIEQITSMCNPSGVTIYDVNVGRDVLYKIASIRDSLRSRTGKVFIQFSHLASTYSEPYPQYSALYCKQESSGGFILEVGGGKNHELMPQYRLNFGLSDGNILLTRIDYLQNESD